MSAGTSEEIQREVEDFVSWLVDQCIDNHENDKHNIGILQSLCMDQVLYPTSRDLCHHLRETGGSLSGDFDLDEYEKGKRQEDKGVNKWVESITREITQCYCRELGKQGEGKRVYLSYPCETMSDISLITRLPESIMHKLKPVNGKIPDKVIFQIDAKGCISSDKDSEHHRFHCSLTQTNIKYIITQPRTSGRTRGYSEMKGIQKTHNPSGIPIITTLVKVVWDCKESTKLYQIKSVSAYVIPSGLIVPVIKNTSRSPKNKTEPRFDIYEDFGYAREDPTRHCEFKV